ncbi:MAG: hypothetical protein IH987_01705 [Planctomycetes bacterium]|nr:hypothetical protein [Planctomycetota bacterium]
MALKADTALGSYKIEALIGKGGMGEVYRARDTGLDRLVSIKVLPESFAANAERAGRFERVPGPISLHDPVTWANDLFPPYRVASVVAGKK